MIHATNIALLALPSDAKVEGELNQPKLDGRGKRAEDPHGTCIKITDADTAHYDAAYTAIIAQMLGTYWPGREKWVKRKEIDTELAMMTPEVRPLTPEKTETFPMGVINVDEGSKKGIMKVLDEIQELSTLGPEEFSSKLRIIEGDLGTVRNLRSARRDRMDDINAMTRLEYVQEISQLFHWALNATHMLVRVHLGNAYQDPGSISNHKDLLKRIWDVNKPDYAASKSLLRHSLIGRLLHCVMLEKGMTRWSDLEKVQPSLHEIKRLASVIQKKYTTTKAANDALEKNDHVLAHACLYLRDVLSFMEFESAVTHGDPGRVLKILKLWVYMFRGAGLTNYAREALEILVSWEKELPDAVKHNLERGWFVNRWGLAKRFIAADLYIEHLNRLVKFVFIGEGVGLTIENIRNKGSSCVEALEEVNRKMSHFFGRKDGHRQTKEKKFAKDLQALVEHLHSNKVHTLSPGREIRVPLNQKNTWKKGAVVDVMQVGAEALMGGKYTEFLKQTTYDAAVGGYPLGENDEAAETSQTTEPEQSDANDRPRHPISYEDEESINHTLVDVNGIGGVGGGDDLYGVQVGEVDDDDDE